MNEIARPQPSVSINTISPRVTPAIRQAARAPLNIERGGPIASELIEKAIAAALVLREAARRGPPEASAMLQMADLAQAIAQAAQAALPETENGVMTDDAKVAAYITVGNTHGLAGGKAIQLLQETGDFFGLMRGLLLKASITLGDASPVGTSDSVANAPVAQNVSVPEVSVPCTPRAHEDGCEFSSEQTIKGSNVTAYDAAVAITSRAAVGSRAAIACEPSAATSTGCAQTGADAWESFDAAAPHCDTAYVRIGAEVRTPVIVTAIVAGELGFEVEAKAQVADTSSVASCDVQGSTRAKADDAPAA